jgi:hypothetical protein
LNPDLFSVAGVITKWIGRFNDLTHFSKNCDVKPMNIPKKLANFKQFRMWNELFLTFVHLFCSVVAGMPLSYLIRLVAAFSAD